MSSASDSQNQTMSFGNNSLVSSYSSSSISLSSPRSPKKTSKPSIQSKPTHDRATFSSSQRPSKPTTTPTKLPSKTSKAIATLPAETSQPKPKITHKSEPKKPSKPRQHLSSTAATKLYTKLAPPPFIPNITPMGATHDPLPTYLHNTPSPAVRPPPPLSIQPLATIYSVDSDASSQPLHSSIVISSPGMPHTPVGTPTFTPPIPPL
ncbi:extensin-like [Benincasa hispida]|uniref:extensin-like n=1 Tax=Benincasa hispida TaxID=102211 RepID=UPI0018FF72AD|nr:extensin-like [Benincasa hispida]